jgi:hypothetical protein
MVYLLPSEKVVLKVGIILDHNETMWTLRVSLERAKTLLKYLHAPCCWRPGNQDNSRINIGRL